MLFVVCAKDISFLFLFVYRREHNRVSARMARQRKQHHGSAPRARGAELYVKKLQQLRMTWSSESDLRQVAARALSARFCMSSDALTLNDCLYFCKKNGVQE